MANPEKDPTSLRVIAIAEATELFEGDQKAAALWLSKPARALQHKKPKDLLSLKEGVEQVRTLIHRLEHGIVI